MNIRERLARPTQLRKENKRAKKKVDATKDNFLNYFFSSLFFLPLGIFTGSVIALRDAGWYSCAAVSESGSILSRAEVNVAKEADRPPPIIQLGPVNQTLPIRTSASLPCQASGAHDAISWLKDGVPLSTLDNRRHVIDSDNTLSIKSE